MRSLVIRGARGVSNLLTLYLAKNTVEVALFLMAVRLVASFTHQFRCPLPNFPTRISNVFSGTVARSEFCAFSSPFSWKRQRTSTHYLE